ncbi:hypothetical protein [Lentzea californiensis]|uniref:hypothetical protein n=1 Tax=Lentzea californiensis TaxID=438851 RepID=UPI00216428A7|nr:hypothetical protein [Lentzea californiensis]MCR3749079.1 hypothetical protein [Lentzea californiensis]
MFARHSGSGRLAFAEWAADGTLLRSHHAESHGQYELADSVASEMFGFTAEPAGRRAARLPRDPSGPA